MTRALRTEADLLHVLEAGTYALADLYRLAEAHGLADRPGGRDIIQDRKEQYKRRVRSAIQAWKRSGRARPGDQPGVWVIDGTVERPRRALLIWLPAEPGEVELVLGDAARVLAEADEPIDLIVADPPWALARGSSDAGYNRTYARDRSRVVGGYVEVPTNEYADFTARWVAAAGEALRPGGYLAVVTGGQQEARIQVAAEDIAGLTYVNSIVVPRPFGLYSTRRFVHSHLRVTLLTRGPLNSPARTFHRPPEMHRGPTGEVYALDVWGDIPPEHRIRKLRYDNALPTRLVSRVVRSCTNAGDLVADPFVGSGTTPAVCIQTGRRFYGGDVNPEALRFTMARLLAEVGPPAGLATPERQLQEVLW